MNYQNLKTQNRIINRRSFLLILSKIFMFSIVGWQLFKIQILKSDKYKTLSKNNQIDIEIVYPLRGMILDRNNTIIANNKKSYDLYIIPEKTDDINMTLNNLNNFINIDFRKKRKIIELSKKVKKFERIKILDNISWQKLEILEANKNSLQGLYLKNSPKRIYNFGNYYSHTIGYINKPTEKDLSLPFISKMPSLEIGKIGLEKYFNTQLIGIPGQREIEVNSIGREIREISNVSSKNGENISITIDTKLQKFIHNELKNHKAGSIVVMKVKSGEIIGMASQPNYNPNKIINKPNEEYWNEILKNKLSPLTNRSVQGLYSPGSTFKMIVALAALKKGVINSNDLATCEGKIEFGDRIYHCWKTKGHGKVNLEKGIKESCDVYFYELSKKVGIDSIAKMAKEFGLGNSYQFGFEDEKKGIIPSKKWKKKNINESWYAGETLIAAIGQGYVLATPLQLAVMTSRIAANGLKILPIIENNSLKREFDQIDINNTHLNLIKKSMFNVVNEPRGTAYKSRSEKYKFSGKTGTSQVKKITIEEREEEDFRKKEKEWKNKDHALFVGYMPSANPDYALSVVIEHGGSGASVAAPIAKKIFDFLDKEKV